MNPAIVHYTKTLSDHTTAITLCGMKLRTDHTAVREAKASGPWVSCPLCEAALALADVDTAIPPSYPANGWTHPTFTRMENHD